ncbi:S-layer homology domain-containing protein [Paenibacillus chitinolyticus]|uniref:S-layer homology domain-containing protein n=1 Tax=Paenibacillus chitinolyticus TaxID=79263 RepID=UPI001C482960|nr:S-layer homology domain-containing protein [Paenibacillus chitinolyticus]MBV6714731.1 S-layer homology domain-containing protein [Paenibacillus chitinolyticus]
MKTNKTAMLLAGALIASSISLSPAYADNKTTDTSTSTQAALAAELKKNFPDVVNTHWALRHITKLALEGIVEGDEKGNYRPEASVSQQDVIIMAVRTLGLESSISENTSYNLPLKVDTYAQKYVAAAIEKKLISVDEEKDGSKNWGSKPASREWVAKLTIRAIGQQETANGLTDDTPAFTDLKNISGWAKPYISAATVLGIVDGFEDGTFRPKGEVTRAQMATFLSRAERHSKNLSTRVVRGYVNHVSVDKISIFDEKGKTTSYKLTPESVFYGNKNDNPINSSELKYTYQVSLVQQGGTAYYAEVLKDEDRSEKITGTLLNVKDRKLTLDNFEAYEIGSGALVLDAKGQEISLSSLVVGSKLELRRNSITGSKEYSQVVVREVPVNKTSEGTVQSVNGDTVAVVDLTSGQSESYTLAKNPTIVDADNRLVDKTAIKAGDAISYTIENSQITQVKIKTRTGVSKTVKGTFSSLSGDKTGIFYKETDGSFGAGKLSANVQVVIDGVGSPSLYDLDENDELSMDIANDQIVKITVTNRSISNLLFATFIRFDSKYNQLNVQHADGTPGAYTISDNTVVTYGGTSMSFKNYPGFASLFTEGKKVDLKVSKNKVTAIQLSLDVSGTITQINTVANEMSIRANNGQSFTFKMYSPAVEIPNKSGATLADLKIGDLVTASLDYNQVGVTKVVVDRSTLVKVQYVNSSQQVTAVDELNNGITFTLKDTKIVKSDGTSATATDILLDDYLYVTYKGGSVVRAEIVAPSRGKVTNVDSVNGTLTIQEPTGKIQLYTIGTDALIKNGTTLIGLNAIKAGDRVQVIKQSNGKINVQLAAAMTKTFNSYEYAVNQIQFDANGSTERYNIHRSAYYHKGSETLTASSFNKGETVTVYIVDNKIIEMEK